MTYFPDRRMVQMLAHRAGQVGGIPVLYAVILPTGAPGPNNVMLLGKNFGAAVAIAVSGTLVTVSNVVVVNPSLITATFTVDPAAAQTARNVTVTTLGTVAGPATYTVVAPAGIAPSPRIWLEADYGIVDAPDAPLTVWSDRSGNGLNTATGPGMTAPQVKALGFGGSSLPYIKFNNASGLVVGPAAAALSLSSFTNFVVALRDPADINCTLLMHLASFGIGSGYANTAASLYTARMPGIQLLQTSRNTVGAGAIPTNVRKIFRHEFDGTNAGHLAYMNGVPVAFGQNQFINDPGVGPSGNGTLSIGYRADVPANAMTGQIAAILMYSPKLSPADTATVETYLAKWLAGGPTVGRGPIILSNSVIDGVTVTVSLARGDGTGNWSPSYQPFGLFASYMIVTFSTPIIQFGATIAYAPYPGDFGKATGGFVGGPVGPPSGLPFPVVGGFAFANTNGDRQVATYQPGFTNVVMGSIFQRADSGYNIAVFQNMRFWLPGDPLYT